MRLRGDREAGAFALLALFDAEASEEERFEGALLLAEALRDLFLLRSALITVRGEE